MRKFLAVLLIILFWIILPLSFLLWSVKATLFKPTTYKTIFIKEDAYNKSIDILGQQLIDQLASAGALPIDASIIKQLFKDTISPLWLQQNVEKLLDNIFPLIANEISLEKTDLIIPTVDLKNKISSVFTQGIEDQIRKLPACNADEEKNLNNSSDNSISLTCLPYGINAEEIVAEMNKSTNQEDLTKDIPNQVDLRQYLFKDQKTLQYYQNWYKFLGRMIIYLFIADAIILLFISLLLMYNIKSMLRWQGLAFFIPAVLFLPMILIMQFVLKPIISSLIIAQLPQVTLPDLINLVNNLSFAFINKILSQLFWPTLSGFIIGLTLVIIAGIIKKKNNEKK